jgi:hypothetical protein
MALDFHAAAVRFGRPGLLRVAAIGAPEPTTVTGPWDPDFWYPLGYTAEGSTFNYNISMDNVEVAEELDVFARVATGRDASVEVALAEMTKKNLILAFNGGVVEGDGTAWSFEPPDLGNETRIMLGWDALRVTANNDLRFIFRQCIQGGSLGVENKKGAIKQTLSMNFMLEKPLSGLKVLKIFGPASLNPDDSL